MRRRTPAASVPPADASRTTESPSSRDAWIQETHRCVVEAFDLDGSTLFERGEDGDLRAVHAWWRPEVDAPSQSLSIRQRFPGMFARLLAGDAVYVSSPDELSGVDRSSLCKLGLKSVVMVPLSPAGRVIGAVAFAAARGERRWPPDIVQRLRAVAAAFGSALARRVSDEALPGALDTPSVGRSGAIRLVQEQVRQVADTDATVLLLGETGAGKEMFASQIHELSRRRGRPMIRVNCAAIPATLIESELFGREKGAYTGALSRQIGRFELADGSTIFLDEIGDLAPEVQIKLLRVLEERQIERLGSSKVTKIDTRIIAATHRDLERRIEADLFREDLYYRLNVFPIRVPPLRERTDDIPMLVWRFVADFSAVLGKRIESIADDNMELLQRYPWPGNVRELRNLVERAVICATGPRLTIALPPCGPAAARRSVRLLDVEKEHVKSVLDSTRWRIRGVGGAAEQLGLKATTLETRMAKLGLRRPPR